MVVVTGVARAGGRVFYCDAMDVMQSRCCCMHASEDAPAAEFVSPEMDCCARGILPSLPTGAVTHGPTAPSAPLAAMLPPATRLRHVLVAFAGYAPRHTTVHATSPPRSAAASCARLSVFLI